MSHENDISSLPRRTSASGNVGYSSPIVLHETSKSRITLVPFYIPHNSTDDTVAAKIVREERTAIGFHETAAISLQDEAARRLYRALGAAYAISEQGGDGDFIVIRSESGGILTSDVPALTQALSELLADERIRGEFAAQDSSSELVEAVEAAVRLQELRRAVLELRAYLESNRAEESLYQNWCERNSWAFGNAYLIRDGSKVISGSDKVDLLLPTVLGGHRDIIELKRPDVDVLLWDAAHKSYYFSSEVSKAIGQCHRYLDVLHEEAKHGLRDRPEIVAYHPRSTIVIGRSRDWSDEQHKALRGLNARMHGITVTTYDHLLAQGQRTVDLLQPSGDG